MLSRLFRLVLVFVLFLTFVDFVPVFAGEGTPESAGVVYCEQAPCEIISRDVLRFELRQEARFGGLYLSRWGHDWEAYETWARVENPLGWVPMGPNQYVPNEIHIRRDSNMSVPLLGLNWWKNQLVYQEPGWMLQAEVSIALSNPEAKKILLAKNIKVPNFNGPYQMGQSFTSYSWDGYAIYSWVWVPELLEDELIVHIFDVDILYLVPATMPQKIDVTYSSVNDVDWIPGEELNVLQSYTGVYPVTDTEAYENTLWKATWTWTEGYEFRRHDGSVLRFSKEDLTTKRACRPEEYCYSTSYYPSQDRALYVEPYTLADLTDSANLHLTDVYPGVQIKPADLALLERRLTGGEVDVVTGEVLGYKDHDGDSDWGIMLTNGTRLELPISYMPPIGTQVMAYVYNDKAKTVVRHLDLSWSVFALFDANGRMWFFNNTAEYGTSFSAYVYGATN